MTSHTFTVPTAPRAKGRPRMTKGGFTYTPKTTVEYEAKVAAAYDGPVFDGPVLLDIDFYADRSVVTISDLESEKAATQADLDNLVKSISDALNGHAYNDDKQVYELKARKHPKAVL